MLQKYHYKKFIILSIIMIFSLFSCKSNDEKRQSDEIVPQKEWKPRVDDRVKDAAKEGRTIFGSKGILGTGGNSGTSTIDFANSNVLWKASLKSLEDIPLANVDYAGGIIITDWYSKTTQSNESNEIKITIKFLSKEVRATSFEVISHKKICLNNKCQISKIDGSFNDSIKEKIVAQARILALEDKKKN